LSAGASPVLEFGVVKWASKRLWLGVAGTVAAGAILLWTAARRAAPPSKQWLQVSTPQVRSMTNAGVVSATVAFCVSNVGPRAVDFQVWWFECRDKRDRALLATNQLRLVNIPFFPGEVTNLTMNVSAAAPPAKDCLCCYNVLWFERRAEWRELRDRGASWALGLLDISWPLWRREHESLTNGVAFASNIGVGDYFRQMYGFTREQWLEELARMRSAPRRGSSEGSPERPMRAPTADEMLEREARNAFADFCRSATHLSSDPESVASRDRAPPK
jgi:hypothetical protein